MVLSAIGAWCFPWPATAQNNPVYYGPAVQMDVLDNLPVAEADVDYRFRAASGSIVNSFIWWDKYGKVKNSVQVCDGYGCGTGGSVDICIYLDDGKPDHIWTGKPLGCVTDSNLRSGEQIRTETFPVSFQLDAGRLYHLHWHNTDANPVKNFISVNDICVWHPTKPRQPAIPDSDLAVIVGTKTVETDTPIFQLNYEDGTTQGQGYKESWNYMPEDISGGARTRELILVTGQVRTVKSLSVRVNRVSGNSALRVTLSTASGAVLEQGEIPAAIFPAGNRLTANSLASQYVTPTWGTYTFAIPRILRSNQYYQLILSAPADTVYQEYAIQKASVYGFSPRTFFADGHGEFSRDNGSTWAGFKQTEESRNHTDADIQFYFTLWSEQVGHGNSLKRRGK
jgi:hypothetical protein